VHTYIGEGVKMKFKLDDNDLIKLMENMQAGGTGATFYDAEMTFAIFETDRKIVKKFIPKPLKISPIPIGMVFLAHYPKVSFNESYNEVALFLNVEHQGKMGAYCIAMPLTNDIALILGREVHGFPKKLAEEISLDSKNNEFKGHCIRRGAEILKLAVKFDEEIQMNDFIEKIKRLTGQESNDNEKFWEMINFNFKYFMNPQMTGLDYKPRLIKSLSRFNPQGKIKISNDFILNLNSSERDHLGDIPIKKPLMAFQGVFTFTLEPGEVVAEVNELNFMPYAFSKLDNIFED